MKASATAREGLPAERSAKVAAEGYIQDVATRQLSDISLDSGMARLAATELPEFGHALHVLGRSTTSARIPRAHQHGHSDSVFPGPRLRMRNGVCARQASCGIWRAERRHHRGTPVVDVRRSPSCTRVPRLRQLICVSNSPNGTLILLGEVSRNTGESPGTVGD